MAYTNLTGFVAGQLADALPDTAAGQAARHLVSVIEGCGGPCCSAFTAWECCCGLAVGGGGC